MSEQTVEDPDDRLGVSGWEVHEQQEVEFLGTDWTLLPTVYPMSKMRSSRFFAERLSEMGPVNTFLEMGCGSGATSVVALKSGMCREATAVDINPVAVENTRVNAKRHGVDGNLRAVESDLYNALDESDRYDLIFWNSPGAFVQEGTQLSAHEASVFDPGYSAHVRYLAQASEHLTDSGRLLLGFCGNGDLPLLAEKAAGLGLSMKHLAEDNEGSHPHWLLEFRAQ